MSAAFNMEQGTVNIEKNTPKDRSVFVGAGDEIRTRYLVITNDVLYLLSYTSAPNELYYSGLSSTFQPLFSKIIIYFRSCVKRGRGRARKKPAGVCANILG